MAQGSLQLRERDLNQDATELPRRFPLVISPDNRTSSPNKDARLVNCYVEKDRMTNEYKLFGRPGLLINATYTETAATGRGIFNWNGDVYAIFGSVIYKNGSSLGTGLNTAGGRYRFDPFLSPSRLLFKNTAAAYFTDGATVTTITDADFPGTTVPGWGNLDATEYVATTSTVRGSDLNAPQLWDPLNTITPQIEADIIVALAKQLSNIIALKQWSTEVFYDAGNATGSPLGRVQGSKADYGCIGAGTLQDAGGALFWVGTYAKGDQGNNVGRPVKMDNLKVDSIETPSVSRLLEGAVFTDAYSFAIGVNGHLFWVITMPTTNLTLAYDIGENMWSQWTDASGNYFPFVSATPTPSAQTVLLQHESSGEVMTCSMSYVNDNGSMFQKDVITPNFDGGLKWLKQLQRLEPVGDQVPGSIIQIRHNDDDYEDGKWSNWRTVDMGTRRPYLQDCGSFVRRAYHLRQKSNASFFLEGLEMTINMGTAGG